MIEYHYSTLFKLTEAYNYGAVISFKNLIGRACGEPHDNGLLAQAVYNSGDGNYLEIGTLFGASAIIAARVKQKFGFKGKVYCIDPLNGFYGKGRKDQSGEMPSKEILMKNAERFGVRDYIIPITKKSIPFPEEIEYKRFSCTFIDGWHWGNVPMIDLWNVEPITTDYLMFDNYDNKHLDVVNAALSATDWTPVHVSGRSYILRKEIKYVKNKRSGRTLYKCNKN